MARTARIVIAGLPHHVIKRGNRRQKVFFNDDDRIEYLRLLKAEADTSEIKVWAYCLMDNHVHLIVVPAKADSLARSIGLIHKRYTRKINFREKWRGYLWQGRFNSFVLDEKYLYTAVRYVERNPVRAKKVQKAEDYRWSSAYSRVAKGENGLLSSFLLTELIKDWSSYVNVAQRQEEIRGIRRHSGTGRPLGTKEFIQSWSEKLGIELETKKPGRKAKVK